MKEILRWLFELESDTELVQTAKASKTNVQGFRIEKAPRKRVVDALLLGDITKHIKLLLKSKYKNEGNECDSLSYEEIKEKATSQCENVPVLLLSLMENNKEDMYQLFEELQADGVLEACKKALTDNAKKSTISEPKEDYRNLYNEALRKIKSLEMNLQRASENEEKLKMKVNTEKEEWKRQQESFIKKLEEEVLRTNEANRNLKEERKVKKTLEEENERLQIVMTQMESQNIELQRTNEKLECRIWENVEEKAQEVFVQKSSGIIIGTSSLQKLTSSSNYTLILEEELTDEILKEAPNIILPTFAIPVITQRKVVKIATDRVHKFETPQKLKDYLKGEKA